MAKNVHDRLLGEKSGLVQRMAQNSHVTGMVMGYLNLFTGIALQTGLPIEGLKLGPLTEGRRNVFSSQVSWSQVVSSMPKIWTPQSDFFQYAKAKAEHMARTLEGNPSLEKWFEQMVTVLEAWARQRAIPFEAVAILDPIVTRDMRVLMFRVARRDDVLRN